MLIRIIGWILTSSFVWLRTTYELWNCWYSIPPWPLSALVAQARNVGCSDGCLVVSSFMYLPLATLLMMRKRKRSSHSTPRIHIIDDSGNQRLATIPTIVGSSCSHQRKTLCQLLSSPWTGSLVVFYCPISNQRIPLILSWSTTTSS